MKRAESALPSMSLSSELSDSSLLSAKQVSHQTPSAWPVGLWLHRRPTAKPRPPRRFFFSCCTGVFLPSSSSSSFPSSSFCFSSSLSSSLSEASSIPVHSRHAQSLFPRGWAESGCYCLPGGGGSPLGTSSPLLGFTFSGSSSSELQQRDLIALGGQSWTSPSPLSPWRGSKAIFKAGGSPSVI